MAFKVGQASMALFRCLTWLTPVVLSRWVYNPFTMSKCLFLLPLCVALYLFSPAFFAMFVCFDMCVHCVHVVCSIFFLLFFILYLFFVSP